MAITNAGNLQNPLLSSLASYLSVDSVESMALRISGAVAILLVTACTVFVARRIFASHMQPDDPTHNAALRLYGRILQIVTLTIGVALAMHTLGIDLSHIFTAGGLLAVAAAFAMKDLVENLYGGLVLRLEGVIKRGDILLLPDAGLVRVVSIGSRNTIVRSKSETNIILPNSFLVQNAVTNYTYGDNLCRLEVTVGVAYSSDLHLVRATLEKIGNALAGKSARHAPQVRLSEFGDSSVTYKIRVWIENPWDQGTIKSDLIEAIWSGLNTEGIEIAVPQLGVHVVTNSKKPPTI
jgi:potassium efflux system protein